MLQYPNAVLLTLFCVLFCFLSTSNCRRTFNIKLGARRWVGTSLWVWLPELAVCPGRKIFFCFIGLCWSSHVPQTVILEAQNQQMVGWDGHEMDFCSLESSWFWRQFSVSFFMPCRNEQTVNHILARWASSKRWHLDLPANSWEAGKEGCFSATGSEVT